MIRQIVKVSSVPYSKKWDLMKRLTSPVPYKPVSLMPKIIWFLLPAMLPIKKPVKPMRQLKCLPYVRCTNDTGNVADRPEQWILMIYCSTPGYCFRSILTCWHVTASSSVTCWSTSIRIPIMHSTALCNNWPANINTFVWWVMMPKVFILSVVPTLITFSILPRSIPIPAYLSWNKTTVPHKP